MKKVLVSLLVGVSVFALTGCGSSRNKAAESYAMTEEAAYDYSDYGYEADAVMAEAYSEEVAGNETGLSNAETVGDNAVSTRKLITTVTMDAEATDFDECAANIKTKVAQYGGYIESESCEKKYGSYTIRIPSKNLDAFLENINEYSNVTYYSSSVEDVTLNYVDIEARISALRTEQKRLEEFMSQAETVEDIITIEDRLSEVRYELQSYESQKRTYDNKIDYSTVNLNVREVSTYTPPVKATISARIKAGLSENMLDLVETMENIVVGIATVVPIIIVALIPIGIVFLIVFLPIHASVKKHEAKRRAENEAKASAGDADPEENKEDK